MTFIAGIEKVDEEFNRAVVHSIILIRGRPVVLDVNLGYTSCTVCGGNDPFCAECNGTNRIKSIDQVTVTGIIHWNNAENTIYRPEGQYVEGDCRVVTAYFEQNDISASGTLSHSLDYILSNTTRVLVDGRYMVIDKYYRKGHPVNRMDIILAEDEVVSE